MSISKSALKKLKAAYLGENVSIYLRDLNVVTVNEEGTEIKVSSVADGLVIEIDEDFVHFGTPDEVITRSVPHESIGLMEIQFEGTLLDGDIPVNDEDVH